MRGLRLVSIVLFILGISMLIAGAIEGDVKGGFFIIFPFVYATGIYAVIGGILIFLSIFMFFIDIFFSFPYGETEYREVEYQPIEGMDLEDRPEIKKEGGAVVMIGPFPIVIASNKRLGIVLLAISLVFIIIFVIVIALMILY